MFLDVNGVRLHAVVFGDGPRTLVATGGWTGSWEVWEDPIGLLTADGWRCVAYDHRGSGESPVDPALITVDAMTDDVVGVLDALGVESCVLAGESQGGAIAQYAAARHPERFSGLVLSAPSRTGRSEGGGGFADACRADYPAAVNAFVDLCFPEPDIEHVRRWARNILLRAEPEQAARIIEMWRDENVPDVDPRRIATRTLILHGSEDAVVPIERSRSLVELLPDAELLVFDGSGHVPTMTRPREVVDAIRRRFPYAAGLSSGVSPASTAKLPRVRPDEWDWSRPVVDHVDLHASDFARSVIFYETVLAPLGIPKLYERDGEASFTHVNVVARTPPTRRLHLCFHARSRDAVDAFHRAGVDAGFESNGAPGLRDYAPGYYAAYLLDPDGNNIEALYRDVGNPGYAG